MQFQRRSRLRIALFFGRDADAHTAVVEFGMHGGDALEASDRVLNFGAQHGGHRTRIFGKVFVEAAFLDPLLMDGPFLEFGAGDADVRAAVQKCADGGSNAFKASDTVFNFLIECDHLIILVDVDLFCP